MSDYLYVGDIGNNNFEQSRKEMSIYRFSEPTIDKMRYNEAIYILRKIFNNYLYVYTVDL